MSAISRADGTALATRAAGIAAGFALDRLVGDPGRFHPVAGFGRVALAVEPRLLRPGRTPNAQRAAGLMFTGVLVGGTAATVTVVCRLAGRNLAAAVVWDAAVVWSCLGGSSLLEVARRQGDLLARGDHEGSRDLLPWLCGRDPAALGPEDLARAVVESVAENTSDAAVATLFWAAVAGSPGAAVHRATNTLDAMVGHRSERYRHFGTAAARLDDVLGFLPARGAGALGVVCAPTVGGSPAGALRAWLRDARAHPSPNAGVVEAVCAGALGVRLGGPTPYPYGVEDRAVLGDGRSVRADDIRRAVLLHDRVQLATAALAVLGVVVRRAVLGRRRATKRGWSAPPSRGTCTARGRGVPILRAYC
ncbi:cobalamin biosynthesis protein [Dietzia kunjamensis]|uniref:cobalamin biosynthesis protein n=1 Tax=Dietzia kunjamensis TaxID=322509 RepID=UPI002DB785F5|nr:cobalamin biosynthesis protein [Dietzia kunjamensis]MEB8327543.1 cobalamin biosynthesis protein [Dietzia kunjamensis]